MPKILLVEDNEANRDMLSGRLVRRGYEVAMEQRSSRTRPFPGSPKATGNMNMHPGSQTGVAGPTKDISHILFNIDRGEIQSSTLSSDSTMHMSMPGSTIGAPMTMHVRMKMVMTRVN